MSKEKMERRKAAGDNPNRVQKSNLSFNGAPPPQPLRDTPQGKGNITNNTMVGQSMGSGAHQPGGPGLFMYMDGGVGPGDNRLGTIGYVEPSKLNQNQVPGRRNNLQAHIAVQKQPTPDTMNMMDGLYNAQQTGLRSQKLYGPDKQMSHMPSPMGMIGQSMEAGITMSGGIPPTFSNQMPSALTPQLQTAAQGQGMDTKRGGGRNKTKKSK